MDSKYERDIWNQYTTIDLEDFIVAYFIDATQYNCLYCSDRIGSVHKWRGGSHVGTPGVELPEPRLLRHDGDGGARVYDGRPPGRTVKQNTADWIRPRCAAYLRQDRLNLT